MTAARRKRRKDDRPREITRAAQAEFAEHGFAAARVAEIARRAGVSKGLVFVYFPTKAALFQAVVRGSIVPVIDGIGEAILADPDTPAPAQLRFVVDTFYREIVLTERRRILHLVIAEGAKFPELADHYYHETIEKGRALLSGIVERGIRRGEFARCGVETHPEIIMAPALLAALWALLFSAAAPLDAEAFKDLHLEMVLRALRP